MRFREKLMLTALNGIIGTAVVCSSLAIAPLVSKANEIYAQTAVNTAATSKDTVNGWINDQAGRHWLINGEYAKNQEIRDPQTGDWYFFDDQGNMVINKDVWLERGQKWVRYGEDGAMVKGEDHRLSPVDGQMHWWYFDPYTGAMAKGLTDVPAGSGTKTVLYDETYGWMLYGEQQIGSVKYLFDNQTGALIKRYTSNGDKVNEIIQTAESLESKNSGLWYASIVTVQPNNTQLPLRCDGFTAYVYYLCDVQAWETYNMGPNRWDNSSMGTYGNGYKGQLKYIESLGRLVRNINELEVGDIVFYGQSDSNLRHAAIYKGNGIIIHAADNQHGITEGPVKDLGDFVAGGSPLNHG